MHMSISQLNLKMVKLSSFYLSGILIITSIISSCTPDIKLYKKVYSAEEKLELSESILNGAGTDLYYQGSVSERQIIKEAAMLNPDNANVWRELGVPYLKRGLAAEAQEYYQKAIEGDSLEWLGYKAYCWLYFYRDYETALHEIDAFDRLTPDFVDYPQSTSVDYIRGICYLQLGKYDEAIAYLEKHLSKEETDVGPTYIEAMPYLLLGVAYGKSNDIEMANKVFEKGIKYNDNVADLYYYYALNLMDMGRTDDAKRAINEAQIWFSKGSYNSRSYVAEFYQIYQEDLDNAKKNLL